MTFCEKLLEVDVMLCTPWQLHAVWDSLPDRCSDRGGGKLGHGAEAGPLHGDGVEWVRCPRRSTEALHPSHQHKGL